MSYLMREIVLEIAKEVGDKAGEGIGYGSLGNAYQGLEQFKTAIQYHQRHLEIAKEVGDSSTFCPSDMTYSFTVFLTADY